MTYAALTLAVVLLIIQTRRLHREQARRREADALNADLRRRLEAKNAELKEAVILVAMAGAEVARERGRGELTVGYGAFWD